MGDSGTLQAAAAGGTDSAQANGGNHSEEAYSELEESWTREVGGEGDAMAGFDVVQSLES
jgi:hypothetical protein